MIRRQRPGCFLLIPQDAHARLSGFLASHLAEPLARPSAATLTAIAMHDAGWPMHDEEPTLNAAGLPLDVFESPRSVALPVWGSSADRAAAVDPYAGLLVSLHVLALSVYALNLSVQRNPEYNLEQARDRFAINQFQHRELERQEKLRGQLGMRLDLPLTYGLAEAGVDEREDQLRADFRLLQAMDLLSLAACCTQPPAEQTKELSAGRGKAPVRLELSRASADRLVVRPWTFDREALMYEVPCRRMEERAYGEVEEFRREYHAAPVEQLRVWLGRE